MWNDISCRSTSNLDGSGWWKGRSCCTIQTTTTSTNCVHIFGHSPSMCFLYFFRCFIVASSSNYNLKIDVCRCPFFAVLLSLSLLLPCQKIWYSKRRNIRLCRHQDETKVSVTSCPSNKEQATWKSSSRGDEGKAIPVLERRSANIQATTTKTTKMSNELSRFIYYNYYTEF